ncbi:MAG: cytochrome-c oxidase, cbb3-type subunit III [Spirochaetia bacterium]|nr:cytochrome-c oxidase, cbb3-type subunit III [Spirochaetia bacterium]
MDNNMKPDDKEKYGSDTGHEWDGIRELKNPPPRWWMISLHASWIFVVVYLFLYPSIPLLHGSTKGLLGWTMIKEYKEALTENDKIKAPFLSKISGMSAREILADAGMRNFAEQSTKTTFGDSCSACHGGGGQGKKGVYPNLTDDEWIYGGDIDTIIETITYGRQPAMPAHKDILDDASVNKLADFVIALSQGSATPEGWNLFKRSNCVACHGNDARGGNFNKNGSGAANLTDKIWRFGGNRDEVLQTIRFGVNQDFPESRKAVMPAWGERLSADQIKMLAVKVYSLGGGQK